MNIYLKKELTINDLPSYYIVYEFNNKTLVYEVTFDYIELRKDINLKNLKEDYILLEDFLKHSLYVEKKDTNSNSSVLCCYDNSISLIEDDGVLYFEYDEAYQLGEDIRKEYTSVEIKNKLIRRANELFNGTTLETINEMFDKFIKQYNSKIVEKASKVVNRQLTKEEECIRLLNLDEEYNLNDLKIHLYKELRIIAKYVKNKELASIRNDEVLDAYNYLIKKLSKK